LVGVWQEKNTKKNLSMICQISTHLVGVWQEKNTKKKSEHDLPNIYPFG